jgi:hypothetical protein
VNVTASGTMPPNGEPAENAESGIVAPTLIVTLAVV